MENIGDAMRPVFPVSAGQSERWWDSRPPITPLPSPHHPHEPPLVVQPPGTVRPGNEAHGFNREALAMDLSLPAERVVRALEQVIQWRGKPTAIRSDYGPEHIGKTLTEWAQRSGVRLDYIQSGKPQQNAYVERFNRTVRYDWLGHYLFESIVEVQDYATNGLWLYDHECPNMALGGITPKQRLAIAA